MQRIAFYLSEYNFELFVRGKSNYLVGLGDALKEMGYNLNVQKILPDTHYIVGLIDEYAILDELPAKRENCYTLVKGRFEPYYSIEQARDESERRLFNRKFDASKIDAGEAEEFAKVLRRVNLGFDDRIAKRGEAIYVPLQVNFDRRKKGQSMSAIEMLRTIRENEPDRAIVTTLRKGYPYKAKDLASYQSITMELDLVNSDAPAHEILPQARYVATMNANTGFQALAWGVPSLLFADADYRQGAVNIADFEDAKDAFAAIEEKDPNADRFLKWYLDDNMIDTTRDDSIKRSLQYLAELGWQFP